MSESELFAFEVPTSRGRFRIIGPDTLPPDEAARIGEQIARLIPLLVLEPDDGLALVRCASCDHYRLNHSSGGMCDGGGTECYCIRFPDAPDFAIAEPVR